MIVFVLEPKYVIFTVKQITKKKENHIHCSAEVLNLFSPLRIPSKTGNGATQSA